MDRLRLSEIFKVGDHYDIIAKYKEIPVKAHLKLNWVDNEGRLLGFDWGRTHIKAAFSTLEPVYIKLSPKEYAQTQVFSNLGKELVLMLENFVEPPEFIKRRSVRVEPDENRPVLVEIHYDGKNITLSAKDVSETGIGLQLDAKEHKDFVNYLKEKIEELKEEEFIELSLTLRLPEGEVARGKGRLRNVVGLSRDVYVRLGFEVDFPREELNKIRRYVINRQREIIQSLRFVE